ncbi:hypothetical protein SSPNP10_17155 [Streptomyces sp. NP10]|nr:hypothetical protein SSPNP10_17155 [Streptomyces sp. NP10]
MLNDSGRRGGAPADQEVTADDRSNVGGSSRRSGDGGHRDRRRCGTAYAGRAPGAQPGRAAGGRGARPGTPRVRRTLPDPGRRGGRLHPRCALPPVRRQGGGGAGGRGLGAADLLGGSAGYSPSSGPNGPGDPGDPAEVLLALARAHPVYCRRDMAAVLRSLRVELAGRDHPVGQAIDEAVAPLLTACERLVRGGRRSLIPPGPPGRDTAAAVVAALEAVPIAVAGRAPHDVTLTERAVRGVLGLPRPDSPGPHRTPGRDRAPPRGVARPPAAAWCCAPCPTGHNTPPVRCPGRSRSAPPPS